ncbi:DinB family protein [Pedobacter sp. ASV12]|uniref:DinB family protein n=1 Tax=Pedobacter sp. ASV12 TaxID=2795120 RepID=UPI00351C9C49
MIELLLTELAQEAQTTRKMLALVPADKLDWAPHEKSMKMKDLSVHIAELPTWVTLALKTDGLDFATEPYNPTSVSNATELLALFEKSYEDGRSSLSQATDKDLSGTWVLRNADQIYATMTKYETIRHAYSQTIHHRAQLGVYLRLLNIPIPGSYGPSADDPSF